MSFSLQSSLSPLGSSLTLMEVQLWINWTKLASAAHLTQTSTAGPDLGKTTGDKVLKSPETSVLEWRRPLGLQLKHLWRDLKVSVYWSIQRTKGCQSKGSEHLRQCNIFVLLFEFNFKNPDFHLVFWVFKVAPTETVKGGGSRKFLIPLNWARKHHDHETHTITK